METRKNLKDAASKNYLPKVDLLAGYNYLGEKAALNLQAEKENVIGQLSSEITGQASSAFQQISGAQLPSPVQSVIYNTSKSILGALYPKGNLEVGKQSYLLAGVFVRQPIYFGGKLKAEQELADRALYTAEVREENARELSAYSVILQYIQIGYLNEMIHQQEKLLESYKKNEAYAENLLKAEILAPYQKNWAEVATKQAETQLENLKLEKENALLAVKSLTGMEPGDMLSIDSRLPEHTKVPVLDPYTEDSSDVRILQNKKAEAQTGVNIAQSLSKPNIFAIGNVQFFRKDLPVILPPWLVGIEMQWTLFDAGIRSRNLAAEALVEETDLLISQKQKAVKLALDTAANKVLSFRKQANTLDEARKEMGNTVEAVQKRLENGLSSVKDVNDVLQLKYQAEKLYYTSLLAYHTALATYYYLLGNPEKITTYL